MEEFKVTGIVLSSTDYKENDKLIEIFTIELGKITGVLKGVKKANAKLKFAGSPFCFGNFILSKSGDRFSIIQIDLIDTFFDITADYDNFQNAVIMLKICKEILKPNILSESLFLNLLNSLKLIIYDKVSSNMVLLKFMLETLSICGYELDFDKCLGCLSPLVGECSLDLTSSAIVCKNCHTNGNVILNKLQFATLKILYSTPISKLNSVKLKEDALLVLVKYYIEIYKNLIGVKLVK